MAKTSKVKVETRMDLAGCYRSVSRDETMALHAAGCPDIERSEKRKWSAQVSVYPNVTIQEAINLMLDAEMREMGWDESSLKVYPCCKVAPKSAPTESRPPLGHGRLEHEYRLEQKSNAPKVDDGRRIKVTDAAKLRVHDMRNLTKWCDNQAESNWDPAPGEALTVAQILALYHAANDAGYAGLDEWLSDGRAASDAACDTWARIRSTR